MLRPVGVDETDDMVGSSLGFFDCACPIEIGRDRRGAPTTAAKLLHVGIADTSG
jgi:hypothetical protein